MTYSATDISTLSLEVERLRFASEFGLKTDHGRLLQLSLELSTRVPRHPISLNIRAFQFLPETGLPRPSKHLSEAASMFAKRDFTGALESAKSALKAIEATSNSLTNQGRAMVVIGDLLLLIGKTKQAESFFLDANSLLGDLPPIILRLGQVKYSQGLSDDAHSLAREALSVNPLYGSAMMLFWESAIKQGRQLAPLPLPERATVDSSSNMRIDPSLSGRALLAWKAWLLAKPSETPHSPPKKGQYNALVAAWRNQNEDQAEQYDDPSLLAKADLERLSRFEDAGILDGYLWLQGLNLSNADSWRQWSIANPLAMNEFWSKAPEL
jgi:tetratricopeptide (TPR) repeat protein